MQTRKTRILDAISKAALLCLFLCSVFPATSLAGPPPVITAQPLDAVVVNGGTATFSVTASSGTAMSYQWYKRELVLILWVDTELGGQTASTLTLTGVGNSDEKKYFVRVTNAGGTVTSRYADLNVVNDDPPVANNNAYTTLEDMPLVISATGILANDTDANGDALTARLVSNVSRGSLSLNPNGGFTYTPNSNYNGADSFTYAAHDGFITGNVATVTINITPVNDASPVANDDTYTTPEDVSLTVPTAGILINDTDVDGDALSALLLTNVSNGSLSLNADGSFTYTPNTNYHGTDRFAYRASDGGNPVVATLQQSVSGGNKIEVKDNSQGAQSFRHGSAGGPAYSVSKVSFRLSKKSGAPDNNLNFSIGTGINSGPLAGSSFAITMASITNTSSGSSFQDYEIAFTATVGPFTAGTTYYLNFDNAPNGKEVWVETSGNNAAYPNGTYYEDGSSAGKDLRFQIHGITHSDVATVTLTVAPMNDAPVGNSDTYTTPEDEPLSVPAAGILTNDLDVDGDALTALLVSEVSHGTLALNADGSFTYTPVADYNGPDSFSYRAADGSSTGNVATVAINVTPVSDPLKFTSLQMTESGFDVGVAGDVSAYVISASSNLRDWTPIFTNAAPTGPIVYTDTAAQNYSSRFYRADTY